MTRAVRVFPSGAWTHVATDTVVLDSDHRRRRRLRMQAEGGLDFLLDLPEAVAIRDGDGLLLDDGRMVAVKASAEPLLAVGASDPVQLARLAWHLGNRHLPVQIEGDRLLVRADDGTEALLARLGATATPLSATFEPEGDGPGHPHGHGDDHGDQGRDRT